MAAKRLDDVEAGRRCKEVSDQASAQLRAAFERKANATYTSTPSTQLIGGTNQLGKTQQ